MSTLVLAELDEQQLAPSLGAVVAAARQGGAPVVVLVAGGPGSELAGQAAAALDGVTQVLFAEGPAHAHGLAEPLADQVLAATRAGGFSAVVAAASSQAVVPSTPMGKGAAMRCAPRLSSARAVSPRKGWASR